MKIDGPKSHGKVFEDDGERVWIGVRLRKSYCNTKIAFIREGSKHERIN